MDVVARTAVVNVTAEEAAMGEGGARAAAGRRHLLCEVVRAAVGDAVAGEAAGGRRSGCRRCRRGHGTSAEDITAADVAGRTAVGMLLRTLFSVDVAARTALRDVVLDGGRALLRTINEPQVF